MSHILLKEIAPLIRVTLQNWQRDRAPRLEAALAYYIALSLAPTVVIILGVAGFAFGDTGAEGRLIFRIQGLVGHDGATVIQAMIKGAHRPRLALRPRCLGW